MTRKCVFSWSGGKDSSLALYYCLADPKLEIQYLMTNVNHIADRISMHGVRTELLLIQVERTGIPLYQVRLPEMPDMKTYDDTMSTYFANFKQAGITHIIYGDIFLEDLKAYRDKRLKEAGLEGIYPLWKRNTTMLMNEFFTLGFGAVIACTQDNLGDIAGEELTPQLISNLPNGIDPCGENGEFHTFAFKGPIFSSPIGYKKR